MTLEELISMYKEEYIHKASAIIGCYEPNYAVFINKTLVEKPELIDELAKVIPDVIRDSELAKADALLESKAEETIVRCNKVMKYIIKFNILKLNSGEMTGATLDELVPKFAPAFQQLQLARPDKAYEEISKLDLTGTPYTDKERKDILNILAGV